LSGKLRIGLAEQSLLVALARAFIVIEKYVKKEKSYTPDGDKFKAQVDEAADAVKSAYNRLPNFDILSKVLLENGIEGLEEGCQSMISVPMKPMLAQPSKGIEEVLKKFNDHKFTCEFKYDGERAQIHMSESGKTYIFSRNQEDSSGKYPDVLREIKNYVKPETKSFILDCEAVAWDTVENRILPFQVLSTRKRKSAEDDEIKVKVCLFAFDLLHLNDKSLIKLSLAKRRKILKDSFNETPGKFMFAKARDVENLEEIQEVLDEAVHGQCEGLMVKTLDSSYEIAKRSQHWLKLKKDYLEGVGDTVDAVVIGAYYGKGKRTGAYGGFLLACYDEDNEQFQTVCKLGTGFKDEDLETHTNFLKQHVIEKPKSYYRIDDTLKPDVWFEAIQVWEIKCADLSLSPVHTAAIGVLESNKGISLRFPRYLRIRDDKKPEEATSASQIVDMYNNQEIIQGNNSEN
jgi:DNA ligase-1